MLLKVFTEVLMFNVSGCEHVSEASEEINTTGNVILMFSHAYVNFCVFYAHTRRTKTFAVSVKFPVAAL